ncbi:MAG TPA: DNA mismatch repair endonuclease MutL [Pyrinomonadaceae bacterium]|nr:DNA mismatch repair endonuclease MutL [Pyrinomonadaceae bacterium]
MSKIRVLADQLVNQIAAGEVVERPASVAKELVENAIDAGARRVEVDVEAGGRRLLRVADDGEGMTRDDALLAFERHATSKIAAAEDLERIATLGFRGEALASIASVARVELVTLKEGETEGTRVLIEGGRMRDVSPAARPRGTTLAVRDLFFNVPARRKFLRSEATESFHLTSLVTHYALAHPEIAFTLTNNGREVLRAAPASDLRERAYQIFGAEFLENLLEVSGGHAAVARVRGYVSAPRERRTSRDAQYLFVNGRYVRDRLVARSLGEGYRSVLPHGVYPAALLFLAVPLEEVDVNVHPAKTEVRFRRASAVGDAVRESVRAALAAGGYLSAAGEEAGRDAATPRDFERPSDEAHAPAATQEAIEFGWTPSGEEVRPREGADDSGRRAAGDEASAYDTSDARDVTSEAALETHARHARPAGGGASDEAVEVFAEDEEGKRAGVVDESAAEGRRLENTNVEAGPLEVFVGETRDVVGRRGVTPREAQATPPLPPLNSAAKLVREAAPASLSSNIRPLGQLEESFIIATDPEGLLLIDQHVAHERILFDKYRALVFARRAESQQLLVPETFDLSPAQATAFEHVAEELEAYGFELTRLSGRTVAVRAVPADIPPAEARNLLAEIMDSVDSEKRGRARATLGEEIAASLACRAAIKINTPLTREKMQWLIDRLLTTSSPTTCPHGRPVILRLTKRDIERGFHRP